MNKRQWKKRRKSIEIGTAKLRRKNRELCKRYPFLLPVDIFAGNKMIWYGKAYSYTVADEFPRGWWKAFGEMLCEDLRNELIKENFLHRMTIYQIKEKFGQLIIYHNGPNSIDRIINNYSHLSGNICINCGKPDVPMLNWHGWLSPCCENCYDKINKRYKRVGADYDSICGDEKQMCNTWGYLKGSSTEPIVVDVSNLAERIRKKYYGK